MREPKKNEFRSGVYTDRPAYAGYSSPAKFEAIKTIVARRLIEHPKAILSYSGGSDSDILLDLVENVRKEYNLPPITYVFLTQGLKCRQSNATSKRPRKNTE